MQHFPDTHACYGLNLLFVLTRHLRGMYEPSPYLGNRRCKGPGFTSCMHLLEDGVVVAPELRGQQGLGV